MYGNIGWGRPSPDMLGVFVEMGTRLAREHMCRETIRDASPTQELKLDRDLAWKVGLVQLRGTPLLITSKSDSKPPEPLKKATLSLKSRFGTLIRKPKARKPVSDDG